MQYTINKNSSTCSLVLACNSNTKTWGKISIPKNTLSFKTKKLTLELLRISVIISELKSEISKVNPYNSATFEKRRHFPCIPHWASQANHFWSATAARKWEQYQSSQKPRCCGLMDVLQAPGSLFPLLGNRNMHFYFSSVCWECLHMCHLDLEVCSIVMHCPMFGCVLINKLGLILSLV